MKKIILLALFFVNFPPLTSFAAEQKECIWQEKRLGVEWQRCGGINVVRLSGSPSERAYNHGLLIREKKLNNEVFNYFSEKIFSPLGQPGPISHWFLEKIYALWVNRLHTPVEPDIRNELAALANGMGVNPRAVERAIVLPDTASFLNGLKAKPFLKFLPPMGCTSIAKKFPNGEDFGFAYGRNLDFASTGLWDTNPQITVQIPPVGSNELAHIAFGAPAVHFGGITGVNSAGITFAVHQNYTHSQHTGGWPMFLVGEMVLRSAHNLKEAEAILKRHRTSPIWTFVVSDLKTGEIMAVEISQNLFRKRILQDPESKINSGEFAQTNDLQHPESTPYEFIQPGHLLNSQERYSQAIRQLKNWSAQDSQNPAKALQKILSYSANPNGHLNAHQDILKAHTIQTVLFINPNGQANLKNAQIALSQDPAPVASGSFLRFSFSQLFSATGSLLRAEHIPPAVAPTIRAEQNSFAKAFVASFDKHDYAEAIELLKNQKSANAFLAKGVFAHRLGKFSDASKFFSQAEKASLYPLRPMPHLVASIDFAQLINQYAQTKDLNLLRPLAEKVKANSHNHWQKKIANKILTGHSLAKLEKSLGFDYFSGDLTCEPYTP